MPLLTALFLAIATVPSQATSLAEIATLCHNPSDVEATKSALLIAGWYPKLKEKQAEVGSGEDETIDAFKVEGEDQGDVVLGASEDLKKVRSDIFERHDGTDLFIGVGETVEPVKPRSQACTLIDTRNSIVGDLANVVSVLKLENLQMKRLGPAYYWDDQRDGKAYSLILPTHRHTKAYLTIVKFGED
jgi:hypothetical protein